MGPARKRIHNILIFLDMYYIYELLKDLEEFFILIIK
jgi:hypothetical protein